VFFSYLWCICLLHPCFVGHGGSGVPMEVFMVSLSTCGNVCMTDYLFFMFVYSPCKLSYILLHVVYALLFYARSHIGHACVVSLYAFLCDDYMLKMIWSFTLGYISLMLVMVCSKFSLVWLYIRSCFVVCMVMHP